MLSIHTFPRLSRILRTSKILVLVAVAFSSTGRAQQEDSLFIRSIYDKALSEGKAYADLRSLCKDIGARLSGSAAAEMAVKWGYTKLRNYGFDTVYLQKVTVPHWERGTTENAWAVETDGSVHKLDVLALGGSIGTNGRLEAELFVVSSLEELKNTDAKLVKGKIVLINQPMDARMLSTFEAYGGCYPIRGDGAIEASRKGAVAVLVRSLAMPEDHHPHTGSMHYAEDVERIPAAAISTANAEWIAQQTSNGHSLQLSIEMDCRVFPDATSYNVIAEIRGSSKANEIITFGGHLDSWDTGEGAHDDGAGIVHCMEALRILRELNYTPVHTLRCVFFMNEENGNMGGKGYADWSANRGEKQVAAVESDRGGFAPRGFECTGNPEQLADFLQQTQLLHSFDLHHFRAGFAGVDIYPLQAQFPGIVLFGLVPDSQRYFDVHHSPNDVFENVNKRELELGCAAMASFLYLIDRSL